MDKITLEKRLVQIDAVNLIALIDLFLVETAKHVVAITIQNRKYQLGLLRRWWTEVGPETNWILTKESFPDFVIWLEAQPNRQGKELSRNTINRSLKQTRQLLRWAFKNDYMQSDVSAWVPMSKRNNKPFARTLPEPAELNRLFRAANESSNPSRDKCILAILIGTGARRNEVSMLDLKDIHFDQGKRSGYIDVIYAKGNKPRQVRFDEITGKYIVAHIVARGKYPGPLFRGQRGNRLGAKGLHSAIKEIIKDAGLTKKLQGCHDFRRIFASHWLQTHRGEGNVQPLSIQLGHESAEMTLHYSKQTLKDTEKIFTSPMRFVDA